MPGESNDTVTMGTREIAMRNELGDAGFEAWAERNEKRLGYEDGNLAQALLRAELEQQAAFQQAMVSPVLLPIGFGVQPLQGPDGDAAVLVVVQTPAYSARIVFPREQALALASQIRKAAQTGPSILTPPAAGRLIVPGR